MEMKSTYLKILLCTIVIFLANPALPGTPPSEKSNWEWKGTLSMASCLNTSPISLRYDNLSGNSPLFFIKSERIILAPGTRVVLTSSRKNFFFMEIPLSYFSGERRQEMTNALFGIELAASSHIGLSVFLELSSLGFDDQIIWYDEESNPPVLTIKPRKESSLGVKGTIIF